MSTNLHFLIIDPQEDFMDKPGSALPVSGATADTVRLAALIRRLSPKIDDIHVTLDTHHLMHIAHPMMWVNSKGEHPAPFTLISVDDVSKGVWKAFNPAHQSRFENYVEKLTTNGKYVLVIWPPHCIIGTPGHNVAAELRPALVEWETQNFGMIDYVTKGSNWTTENYSAVMADVPDPNDPTTGLNVRLIETLQEADIVAISGQALSHCVANTVRDIANNFGEENLKKLWLIRDTCSSVTGFEQLGEDFVKEMVGRGMNVSTAADFLA
jgi:nicotinamidase/pyrazinamidase